MNHSLIQIGFQIFHFEILLLTTLDFFLNTTVTKPKLNNVQRNSKMLKLHDTSRRQNGLNDFFKIFDHKMRAVGVIYNLNFD